MRLEFDANGYVCTVVFGCETGACSEYTGAVPEDYSSYADWADNARVQAYYLNSSGNLTYDANRAAQLPEEDSIEPYSCEHLRAMGILDAVYPVGSIYMSVNSESPETLFGGVWEQIQDQFILSAGSTYSAGSSGGAASYNLSATHKHIAPIGSTSTAFGAININGNADAGSGKSYKTADIDYSGTLSENVNMRYTSDATVTATIPTLPPYLAVFVWKRTQ